MTDIPFDLFGIEPGEFAVGTVFLRGAADRRARVLALLDDVFEQLDLILADQRTVPIDTSVLGRRARAALPTIVHLFIKRPTCCRTESSFHTRLYYAKQALRTHQRRNDLVGDISFTSLSTRTIVYKALTRSDELAGFYPDLQDERFATRFALFHRRFSTNTSSTWGRAQPFRMVAHNGEINTIASNRAWLFAREQALGLPRDEILTRSAISDSGSLNEMVEALRFRSGIPHLSEILALMMPPARRQSNDFYRFWSRAVEPWDGPAFLAYSDGHVVGARLDRNGFRPCRWAQTNDAFYLASEAGIFGLDEREILAKGALQGGSGAHVTLADGQVHFVDPSVSLENKNATFDPRIEACGSLPVSKGSSRDQAGLFGWTREEVEQCVVPMAAQGKEPIGSMGDTASLAVLSDVPRSIFDFFFQNFAQVTNPPVDHLRERPVMDLSTVIGKRPNVFEPKTLIPVTPGIELDSPILRPEQLEWVRQAGALGLESKHLESVEIDATFARVRGPRGLEEGLEALKRRAVAGAEGGCSILILSHRRAKWERPPIPSLLALGAVDAALLAAGRRLDASVVLDVADACTTHHVAMLISFGAAAVSPYLLFEVASAVDDKRVDALSARTRQDNLHRALDEGLLKVMSKMGICSVRGYQGSKLAGIVGLDRALVDRFFPGTPSPLGGVGLDYLAEEILARPRDATPNAKSLVHTYQLREHNKGSRGERHGMTAALSRKLHDLIATPFTPERFEAYEAWRSELRKMEPTRLRHLLRLKTNEHPTDLDDVQAAEEILRTFGSGAMSFGAISAESQRDLIKAMRKIGGRSGSGEGGENPYYFVDGTSATTKQVASARFGVTAEYLVTGREIEIKIAQGAKPGEGGQLMAAKVNPDIAHARFASPGVDLISPPPLHDIYSIEDLRELIYQFKQLKPSVPVVVKLVAGVNVGTIAAGVVKAGADVVQISGGDGGTGAASLSSMKHAGLPWELGIVEAHETLLEQGLREHTVLRVDGGLTTGEDLVKAALLGAEEFGFGKMLLVAEGCIMARVCEKNTCPRGIATHDPKFKAKYRGSPEQVVTWLRFVAEDVRRHLARLGVRRLDEIVGRADLLEIDPAHAERVSKRALDLGPLMTARPHPRGFRGQLLNEGVHRLNARLEEDALPALESGRPISKRYPIASSDRAVLATLSGRIAGRTAELRQRGVATTDLQPDLLRFTFEGSAGQGFGAFLVRGLDVTLLGEANDAVGKSMSGGTLVIRPPEDVPFVAESNVIIGNTALYGATAGRALIRGRAQDRFCVRNSGAEAVVEGAGLHACEYMTGGAVAILGPVSDNVGAGMTGGLVFLHREEAERVNREYIAVTPMGPDDLARFVDLLKAHLDRTGSETARALLEIPDQMTARYVVGRPVREASRKAQSSAA